MPESQESDYLLSKSVIPTNYKIRLWPDLGNFTFRGEVVISLSIRESVREITLHAVDLGINASDVSLQFSETEAVIVAQEVRFDEKAQTATFVFGEDLCASDSAFLRISYTGIINENMAGFYRSKYVGADGEERYMATTQFEATDARRALPCWDEPACKATFDVCLVVPEDLTALSNMPIEKVDAVAGFKTVTFGRTPIMSTYLLAFIVGQFEHVETQTYNGTIVRVYTLPGKSEQGRFALEVGRRSLELYNEYFGISYPLPKLDMIAIPDFAAGAMENWGLVTYRENALLVDDVNSSAVSRQRVAEVVAHELAHQWFGNLVTMEWWTNLWLNEGFATWMANFVLDKLFPEWDIWTQFLSDDYAQALSLDGLRSTHPIEVPVGHPDEVRQIFDAISYSKGSCAIRMIHDFIGADAFRRGMQIYLRRHAYGNAVTEDLWQALEEASGQPVREMMDTWTKQSGYPLIQVESGTNGHCTLFQRRFLASGEQLTVEEADQQWHIPLMIDVCYKDDNVQRINDVRTDKLVGLVPTDGVEFVKINSGQVALARVNYLPEQWQALAEAVRNGKLDPKDRYGLLSDALALARAGHLSASQLINLISAYSNEDSYPVCMMVISALGALNAILEETPHSSQFASFARSALGSIASRLGWSETAEETHSTRLLRGHVLMAMGEYGDQDVITEARNRFHNHASNTLLVDPDLRRAVYSTTARYGDGNTLQTMLDLYRRETFQEERVRLLAALGGFTDPVSTSAVIEHAFNSGEVRQGDIIYTLSGVGSHIRGRRAAWKFIVDNWEKVAERYSDTNMIGRIISLVCDGFAQSQDAEIVERFFDEHPVPKATRAVAESLERIRVRAAWYERDKDKIAAALAEFRAE